MGDKNRAGEMPALASKQGEARMKSRSGVTEQIKGTRFDVCVIGGGATGAGCALDAQLRGLRTVLLEAGDFVSATSGFAPPNLCTAGSDTCNRRLRSAISASIEW